jgi:hypothetical protein
MTTQAETRVNTGKIPQTERSESSSANLLVDGDDTYKISEWRKLADPVLSGDADMVVAARFKKFKKNFFSR